VYHLLCTEFCGTAHSEMRGDIVVMAPADYADWLARQDVDLTLAERGAALFRSYGCSGCHENSDVVRAPSLYGVYGHPVPVSSGGFVVADEQYIRDSILFPMEQAVAGYRPVMPSFRSRIPEEDLIQLVAFIESLATSKDYRS
jgi:cytochrome c oxidase subunit 2